MTSNSSFINRRLFAAVLVLAAVTLAGCSQPCADPSAVLVVPGQRAPAVTSVTTSDGCELTAPCTTDCACPSGTRGCTTYRVYTHDVPKQCVVRVEFNDGCAPFEVPAEFAHTAGCCGDGCYAGDGVLRVPGTCGG